MKEPQRLIISLIWNETKMKNEKGNVFLARERQKCSPIPLHGAFTLHPFLQIQEAYPKAPTASCASINTHPMPTPLCLLSEKNS